MAKRGHFLLHGRNLTGLVLQLLPQVGAPSPELLSGHREPQHCLPQGLLVPSDLFSKRLVLNAAIGEIYTFGLHDERVILSEMLKALGLCPEWLKLPALRCRRWYRASQVMTRSVDRLRGPVMSTKSRPNRPKWIPASRSTVCIVPNIVFKGLTTTMQIVGIMYVFSSILSFVQDHGRDIFVSFHLTRRQVILQLRRLNQENIS